jgi:target of rapamycin complex subunit LST8
MMPVVLATGSLDHRVRLWDATSGYCLKTLTFNESQVNCVQISPDKKHIAVGGNPLIQVFEVNGSDDKPTFTYDGHSNNVTSIGFQKDQKWLFSSSEDGTIKIWDRKHEVATKSFDCGPMVNTVALHPNQVVLVSGDQLGCIKIWDLECKSVSESCKEQHIPAVDVPIRSISIVSILPSCFML